MQKFAPIRSTLLIATISCALAAAAQKLPATPPTTQPALPPSAAPQAAATPLNSSQPARRAQITFTSGQLTIAADNSSLNQILREIGRATGMKITGGVTDERVYGTYGPSDASTILYALLNGTGSNIMLVLDARQAPQELVLTPRGGGPTPPNPNAGKGDDRGDDDLPPQRETRFPGPAVQPQPQPQIPQLPPDTAAPPAPTPPTPGTTTQQSPNGVATPQQIYDQLMKMQQQKNPNGPQ